MYWSSQHASYVDVAEVLCSVLQNQLTAHRFTKWSRVLCQTSVMDRHSVGYLSDRWGTVGCSIEKTAQFFTKRNGIQIQLHNFGWNNSSHGIWILYFACSLRGVHLCLSWVLAMIFAVLELWLLPLHWVLNW